LLQETYQLNKENEHNPEKIEREKNSW